MKNKLVAGFYSLWQIVVCRFIVALLRYEISLLFNRNMKLFSLFTRKFIYQALFLLFFTRFNLDRLLTQHKVGDKFRLTWKRFHSFAVCADWTVVCAYGWYGLKVEAIFFVVNWKRFQLCGLVICRALTPLCEMHADGTRSVLIKQAGRVADLPVRRYAEPPDNNK